MHTTIKDLYEKSQKWDSLIQTANTRKRLNPKLKSETKEKR